MDFTARNPLEDVIDAKNSALLQEEDTDTCKTEEDDDASARKN